jgi:hypothetical protein
MPSHIVMPGLVPGIHVFCFAQCGLSRSQPLTPLAIAPRDAKDVDGRDKPGHDGEEEGWMGGCLRLTDGDSYAARNAPRRSWT